jgi:DTW domain-containing protein YfiP
LSRSFCAHSRFPSPAAGASRRASQGCARPHEHCHGNNDTPTATANRFALQHNTHDDEPSNAT